MFGEIYTPFGSLDLYYVSMNIGSVIAVIAVAVLLYKKFKGREAAKHMLLTMLLCALLILIGKFVGTFVRQTSYDDYGDISGLLYQMKMGYGNHFIGRVLTIALLFPVSYSLLYPLLFKERRKWFQDCMLSLDILSFFLLIQHFFNRLGCLCRGCCFGIPYHGILALKLPKMKMITNPVFPVQPLEMSGMLILLFLAAALYKKGRSVFGITLCGFGSVIWISECFMDKRGTRLILGWSMIQYTALLLIFLGILYILTVSKKQRMPW